MQVTRGMNQKKQSNSHLRQTGEPLKLNNLRPLQPREVEVKRAWRLHEEAEKGFSS